MINLSDTSSYTSLYLLGLFLSWTLLNILSNLHISPWSGKIIKFIVSRLLENAFASQNIESKYALLCIFMHYPQYKILP